MIHSAENPIGIFNIDRPYLRMRGAEKGNLSDNDGGEIAGWYLTNRRYGHGVGLSQRGAQQRAESGYTLKDIVQFYYENTELVTFKAANQDILPTSTKYTISSNVISDVETETDSEQFLNAFNSNDANLAVVTYNGAAKESGWMMTGDMIRIKLDNDTVFMDIPVAVIGDTNGDGEITKRDMNLLHWHILGTRPLSGPYLKAADVNQDDAVDNMDLLALIWYFTGSPVSF